jgi:protease YdgD
VSRGAQRATRRRRKWLGATAAGAVLLASTLAAGQPSQGETPRGRPALPGVGAEDPRVGVDPAEAPWRSLGKLQATAGSLRTTCTVAVVAPATVLTAAHCVFNPRTRRTFPPSSLHVLIGYDRGRWSAHARVLGVLTGMDYDPAQAADNRGGDWALLTIEGADAARDRILPLADRLPAPGTVVSLGGYSQDKAFTITADLACRVVRHAHDTAARLVLRHDCTATRGASGAPLLLREGSHWLIAGIDVAAAGNAAGGVAAWVEEARAALLRRPWR